ncbi:MAG: site-specific integrase [Myxococcota bacterium]
MGFIEHMARTPINRKLKKKTKTKRRRKKEEQGRGEKPARPRYPKPTTLQRIRSTMSGVFSWAVLNGDIQNNPFRGLKMKKPQKPVHEWLSPEDVRKRLDALEADEGLEPDVRLELKLFAELCYECGLRLSECAGLRRRDFRMSGRPRLVLGAHTKTSEGRTIPLMESDGVTRGGLEAARELLSLDTIDRPGFPESPWSFGHDKFCRLMTTRMKKLGFAGTSMHALRHAFASKLVNSGHVSINIAAEILGHKNITTTMKYVHAGEDAKFEAMQRMVDHGRNS